MPAQHAPEASLVVCFTPARPKNPRPTDPNAAYVVGQPVPFTQRARSMKTREACKFAHQTIHGGLGSIIDVLHHPL